jgi:hypothetical protein
MREVAEAIPLTATLRVESYFIIEGAGAYGFDAVFQSLSSEKGWAGDVQGQVQ